MRNVLLYFALKYKGDWNAIYNALDKKEIIADKKIDKLKEENYKFITIIDKNYPRRLKRIYQPPFVLFYKGDIGLINPKTSLAVIGARKASKQGIQNVNKIVKDLENIAIVSGLAKGIDGASHLSALENGLETIAVLGSGIDYIYPSENKDLYNAINKKGLILSEYPEKTPPTKYSFKARNRIISGLGDGILVVEAKHKSGTMNTVKHGLQQNKDIYCLPSSDLGNSGTNHLIKEGAILVEDANDIIKELPS